MLLVDALSWAEMEIEDDAGRDAEALMNHRPRSCSGRSSRIPHLCETISVVLRCALRNKILDCLWLANVRSKAEPRSDISFLRV